VVLRAKGGAPRYAVIGEKQVSNPAVLPRKKKRRWNIDTEPLVVLYNTP